MENEALPGRRPPPCPGSPSLPWKPQQALPVEAEEGTDGHDEQELMRQRWRWPDALVQG